jgi:hypothetical protein
MRELPYDTVAAAMRIPWMPFSGSAPDRGKNDLAQIGKRGASPPACTY